MGLRERPYFHTVLPTRLRKAEEEPVSQGKELRIAIHMTPSEPVGAIVTGSSLEEKASHPGCFLIVYKEGKYESFVASIL